MPVRADLRIYQGDDFVAVVTVNGGEPPEHHRGLHAAQAQIREDTADNCTVVAAEIAAEVVSPLVNLTIPADVTVNLCGQYVWDLQLIDPDGGVSTFVAGNVVVTPEVTRESTPAPQPPGNGGPVTQTPWTQNIDAAGFSLSNVPSVASPGTSPLVLNAAGGSVGIGKTPAFMLDVAGDVNCGGSFRVNGVVHTGRAKTALHSARSAARLWDWRSRRMDRHLR